MTGAAPADETGRTPTAARAASYLARFKAGEGRDAARWHDGASAPWGAR